MTATVGGSILAGVEKDAKIIAKGRANITGGSGVYIIGDIGASDYAGVVTATTVCPFTGKPHSGASTNVFATSGGKKM
jgi:hypothetical protein